VAPVAQQCSQLGQDFIVYFEWDRADITSAAAQVIDAAVANVRAAEGCTIQIVNVVGHTDTSGSAAYNERLSVRRADAVAGALGARGVPSNLVQREGRGQRDLALETRDNVREPLNRRSEVRIVLQ
jgi:outer membrane protein OmpA-like peptidoglycan-associated protein